MQITDVRIRTMDNGGKMKAVASVTFDDEFVVFDIETTGLSVLNCKITASRNKRRSARDFSDCTMKREFPLSLPMTVTTSENPTHVRMNFFSAYRPKAR